MNHSEIGYLQRVQDENKLLFLTDAVTKFLAEFAQHEYNARLSVIKLQYLYYKSDNVQERIRDRLQQRGRQEEISRVYFVEKSGSVIAELV